MIYRLRIIPLLYNQIDQIASQEKSIQNNLRKYKTPTPFNFHPHGTYDKYIIQIPLISNYMIT